jgi:tetratricopeptide (TPR) repeat protein
VLDRYTADWLRMYGDACAATHLRGEQSADVLDLRIACLKERLGRVNALTEVFVEANATVVDNAVQATSSLPTLDRCGDVTLLRAVMPPPEDPKARARLESLRLDLARVRALGVSGQCGAAATAARALIAAADELAYLPLLAESLISSVRSQGCAQEASIRNLTRAVWVGLASHHEEAAAEAAIYLAHLMADRTPDVARAREWIDMAGALMQGMSGTHPVLEAWRLQALALVYTKEGNDDAALDTFERARALIEKIQGPQHIDYANITNNIGVFFLDRKRYREALVYFRRSAELAESIGGPKHSLVALAHFNSAEALNAMRRYDEALASAERAVRIWQHAGSDAFYLACASTMLGEALLGQGHPQGAAARLEEAVALFKDDASSWYPQSARFGLARALWESPAQHPRALTLAREAKAGYQRLGNLPGEVAKVDSWLRAHDGHKRGRGN